MVAAEFHLHIENRDGTAFERLSPATVSAEAVIAAASITMPATLASGAMPDMAIHGAESFVPATTLFRACGGDHAVEIANDSEYGPSRATFARDTLRGMAVAKRRETGIVHGIGPAVGDKARMPFGGTSTSAYGLFGGTETIDEFAELRRIAIEDPNQDCQIRG